jgi:hypothetical protein
MSASTAASIRATLENELSWRRNEIRNLRNMQAAQPGFSTARIRALLVMLYAHLEGFSKFALEQYAAEINRARVPIPSAKKQLAAACLATDFRAYRSSDPGDPNDPEGNRARQVVKDAELVEKIMNLHSSLVVLDVEAVTSADSNLSPVVLHRNLSLLALEGHDFHRFTSAMNGLLRFRNNVAHGEAINVPSDQTFRRLEDRIFDLCETLTRSIYEAVRDEDYLRLYTGPMYEYPEPPCYFAATS